MLINTTISDDPDDERKRLMTLSKDEIIEQLLAAKVSSLSLPSHTCQTSLTY